MGGLFSFKYIALERCENFLNSSLRYCEQGLYKRYCAIIDYDFMDLIGLFLPSLKALFDWIFGILILLGYFYVISKFTFSKIFERFPDHPRDSKILYHLSKMFLTLFPIVSTVIYLIPIFLVSSFLVSSRFETNGTIYDFNLWAKAFSNFFLLHFKLPTPSDTNIFLKAFYFILDIAETLSLLLFYCVIGLIFDLRKKQVSYYELKGYSPYGFSLYALLCLFICFLCCKVGFVEIGFFIADFIGGAFILLSAVSLFLLRKETVDYKPSLPYILIFSFLCISFRSRIFFTVGYISMIGDLLLIISYIAIFFKIISIIRSKINF
jgi:hypothetical protein